MKAVILGGGGFIGSAIADKLMSDGHQIRIFERPRVKPYREFKSSDGIEWVVGDSLSKNDISAAIHGMDVVYHLISTTLPKSSNDDPVYDVQTNLTPTIQLLNEMVESDVRKIIFISSGGTVYGKPEYLPIDENHPTNPLVSYGITKLAIEKYLKLYERQYGIKFRALRVANPYGERQRVENAQGAVAVFIRKALLNEEIEIWGDGTVVRDYLHIDDVAEAFGKVINYNGDADLFNISSGIGTSLNQIIEIIEKAVGKRLKIRYLPRRSFDTDISILASNLAEQQFGWKAQVSIEDGIARTVDWMRKELSA